LLGGPACPQRGGPSAPPVPARIVAYERQRQAAPAVPRAARGLRGCDRAARRRDHRRGRLTVRARWRGVAHELNAFRRISAPEVMGPPLIRGRGRNAPRVTCGVTSDQKPDVYSLKRTTSRASPSRCGAGRHVACGQTRDIPGSDAIHLRVMWPSTPAGRQCLA